MVYNSCLVFWKIQMRRSSEFWKERIKQFKPSWWVWSQRAKSMSYLCKLATPRWTMSFSHSSATTSWFSPGVLTWSMRKTKSSRTFRWQMRSVRSSRWSNRDNWSIRPRWRRSKNIKSSSRWGRSRTVQRRPRKKQRLRRPTNWALVPIWWSLSHQRTMAGEAERGLDSRINNQSNSLAKVSGQNDIWCL